MGSREAILAAVAGAPLSEPAPPEDSWPRIDDPVAALRAALEAAGGTLVIVADEDALATGLAALRARLGAAQVFSSVAALASTPGPSDTPHELDDVALAIASGAPAVAESGAVWVVPASLQGRAALWLAQHVALVVPRDALVSNLHEAYARIGSAPPAFGCFVSGPSKTADIEQALVIGAHGPRSLTLFLVG